MFCFFLKYLYRCCGIIAQRKEDTRYFSPFLMMNQRHPLRTRVGDAPSACVFLFLFFFPSAALAADARTIALNAIQIFWWIALAASIGVLAWGFVLLRSRRDDLVEAARAKKFVLAGAIGAVISIIFLVVLFIIGRFFAPTAPGTGGVPQPVPGVSSLAGFTPLGQFSKVASTYPARDEQNVARNVRILVTFTEAISRASVADERGILNADAVRISAAAFKKGDEASKTVAARAELSPDGTILTIIPDEPLGAPDEKARYLVSLTSAIHRANGESLFGDTGGYSWGFEVSGIMDNTPPAVESILPIPDSTDARVAKNALVQITFTKPLDPSALQGGKIQVLDAKSNTAVSGSLRFGNTYRTVTFYPTAQCGKNSCGQTVYCLPEKASLKVVAAAATLPASPNAETPNRAKAPHDGIVDVSGNSLDGGGERGAKKNGRAEGPPNDSFFFAFQTTDQLFTEHPKIARIEPGRDGTGVAANAPIRIRFSNYMDLTSLHAHSVILGPSVNYWITSAHEPEHKGSSATINHDVLTDRTLYSPQVTADVVDAYQNCFNPCIGP